MIKNWDSRDEFLDDEYRFITWVEQSEAPYTNSIKEVTLVTSNKHPLL